jgi:adenylate cyclase
MLRDDAGILLVATSAGSRVSAREAAVLAATPTGHEHLLAHDDGLAERLAAEHRDLALACVRRYGGRAAAEPGGGVLAAFPSISDAARCALELDEADAAGVGLRWRVGLHWGRVDDALCGDGADGASRLADLADEGRVVASGAVRDALKDRLELGFEALDPRLAREVPADSSAFRLVARGAATTACTPRPPAHPLQRALAAFGLLLLLAAAAATVWIVLGG